MIIKKFQQGGEMPTGGAPAPAPEQGGAPQGGGAEEQLAQMAQQIVEQLGPEAAAMLAQMLMQMVQGAAQQAPQGQPTYARQGGKLVMIGRK